MNKPQSNAMTASSSENPSGNNPFRMASAFNLPLKVETCLQIHADALRRTARNPEAYVTPAGVPVAELRARARRFGPQVYLAHPAEIESLYCSRLGRSWAVVYQILRAMALEAGIAPIDEEAVWAICMHLEELRAQRTDVTVERSSSTWWLAQLTLASSTGTDSANDREGTQQIAALVIDTEAPRALALRAGGRQVETELSSLAIYDAIALERRPAPLGAAGLVWHVPSWLMVEKELPEDCQRGCRSLGVLVERATRALPLVEELRACWAEEQARRTIPPGRRALVFESVLNRVFGTSPQRAREERERTLGHLVGYARDPADLFPTLRAFLPAHAAMIGQNGEVAFDGLHYVDRVLSYWTGSHVEVRRSEQIEAVLWVYLQGEILCRARARELARRDGSYRAARAGR